MKYDEMLPSKWIPRFSSSSSVVVLAFVLIWTLKVNWSIEIGGLNASNQVEKNCPEIQSNHSTVNPLWRHEVNTKRRCVF